MHERLAGQKEVQRLHEGSREEVREWKQQLIDKLMGPEMGSTGNKRGSIIQKVLNGDTNQSKAKGKRKKKALAIRDLNQRMVTNWFCKVEKKENIQKEIE